MTAHKAGPDEPKDFFAVKGRFTLHISPQTPRGWWLGALWTLGIMLPAVPLIIFGAMVDGTPQEPWIGLAVLPFLLLMGVMIWVMIRWMLARADIVSPEELKDMARDRASRPGRRRQ